MFVSKNYIRRCPYSSTIPITNYKIYKPKDFDLIWASGFCTEYSQAKTIHWREKDS